MCIPNEHTLRARGGIDECQLLTSTSYRSLEFEPENCSRFYYSEHFFHVY